MKMGETVDYVVNGRTFQVEKCKRYFSTGFYYYVHCGGNLYGTFCTLAEFKGVAKKRNDWYWSNR